MSSERKSRLVTYSGQEVWGRVRRARSPDEIRVHLAEARRRGWTVSFRGGGMSFDTQALNQGMVIQLEGFDHVGPVTAGHVTVGTLATWGRIVEATRASGFLPYVVVSTPRATAGGTLATNALSRFSPTCGKEGTHVRSFRLMLLDGTTLTCSREEHSALFFGVIGGFGYLGVVLEITYHLLPLGFSNVVVETQFERFSGLEALAEKLVTEVTGRPPVGDDRAPLEVAPLDTISVEAARAISAVLYMNAERQGFVMRSRYVDGDVVSLAPSPFHSPRSFSHRLLQALIMNDVIRPVGYELMMDVFMRSQEKKTAVDDLFGYTFFQDGNDAVKRFFRKLGFPMGIRQQTFVVPVDADSVDRTRERLTSFLVEADRVFDDVRLVPVLIDVLYLPKETEGFAFSASRGLAGYAITFTFEELGRSTFPVEERLFAELALFADGIGGRVHLVKNVHASSHVLERSYADGVSELLALRETHDPERILSNGFLARVFPSLARA
jgi:decaprenylphospho-beta-D-ribofuranose 2-oxidase